MQSQKYHGKMIENLFIELPVDYSHEFNFSQTKNQVSK